MATVLILLLVGMALFVAAAAWKLVDAWRSATDQDMLTDLEGELQELQTLAVSKARMLRDIKDLEFDYETGHVSPEDYNDMRRRMEARAIVVLKRLDELRGSTDYDALIDAGYSERFGEDEPRKQKRRQIDASPPQKPKAPKEPEDLGCAACSAELEADSKFCSTCGTPVEPVAVAQAPAAGKEALQ